ncbi:MAG: hypothetical protein HFG26_05115 [Provencibacterium sp.]|jgi:hypothetical protein|nr:hypothetical protein [Provencibacterium sp.]
MKWISAACALALSLSVLPAGAAFNHAPTIESELYETAEGVSLYGSFKTYDPEGDEVSVSVSQPPSKGRLEIDGLSFQYTPFPGESGEDPFTVTACDRYGNRSKETVLSVTIHSGAALPYFCDMDRNPYEYSALKLAEAGVMSGERIGGRLFFYPQREMNRGELIVLLLACRGWDLELAPCINTGLENDAEIPLWLKPYIRCAIEKGIVLEGAFDTETIPTRAEAVVLCCRAAGIDDILKYRLSLADVDRIPDWAMESYLNLAAYRMLDLSDGYAYPSAALDRAYAAALGWQLYKYAQAESAR